MKRKTQWLKRQRSFKSQDQIRYWRQWSEVEPRLWTRRSHCEAFRQLTCTFRVNTVINIVLVDNRCLNSSQFCCCFIRIRIRIHGIFQWLSRRALFPLRSFLSCQLFGAIHSLLNSHGQRPVKTFRCTYCIPRLFSDPLHGAPHYIAHYASSK